MLRGRCAVSLRVAARGSRMSKRDDALSPPPSRRDAFRARPVRGPRRAAHRRTANVGAPPKVPRLKVASGTFPEAMGFKSVACTAADGRNWSGSNDRCGLREDFRPRICRTVRSRAGIERRSPIDPVRAVCRMAHAPTDGARVLALWRNKGLTRRRNPPHNANRRRKFGVRIAGNAPVPRVPKRKSTRPLDAILEGGT